MSNITIRATDSSIASVFWNDFEVVRPNANTGYDLGILHCSGNAYITADGRVTNMEHPAWTRPEAPQWKDTFVQAILADRAQLDAAFAEADRRAEASNRAHLRSMSPADRRNYLAEYGPGSVDER